MGKQLVITPVQPTTQWEMRTDRRESFEALKLLRHIGPQEGHQQSFSLPQG